MDVQAKFVEQELGAAELISVNAANIPMRAIEWLWPNRLAYGKLGLLGGLPDMGKGLITAFMMACITTRMGYPCGEGAPPRLGRDNVRAILQAISDCPDTEGLGRGDLPDALRRVGALSKRRGFICVIAAPPAPVITPLSASRCIW